MRPRASTDPELAPPDELPNHRPFLGALAGGLLLGLASLSSQAWALAWIGVACTSFALARESRPGRALLGLGLGALLQRLLWLSWSLDLARAMVADPWYQTVVAAGLVLLTALPVVLAIAVGRVALHGRLPVVAWLPAAWALGERLQVDLTSIASDWLLTQVDVGPVMGLLARAGMVPATLLCLTLAAGAGEAMARRRPAWAGVAAGLAALVALVPPPARGDLRALEGIGVVHMQSDLDTPSLAGVTPPPELVVWPEAILAERPMVAEGSVRRARLHAFTEGHAEHVVGAVTAQRTGFQNALLAVDARGKIAGVRAKRLLIPPFERSILGFGWDVFVPSTRVPYLRVRGRDLIPLICGELFSRDLVAAGVRAGGRILLVAASDRYQGGRAQAAWEVLALLRLRAIEFHLPAVYSSLEGQAAIIAADGTVLARSAPGAASGILTWSPARGAQDHIPPFRPTVTVLYDPRAPHLRPDCPPGRCRYLAIDEVGDAEPSTPTVIVTGHGTPTTIAGVSARMVARKVATFAPDLVVLDACFSASVPLLSALAERTQALVVAVAFYVQGHGLSYDPPLFADAPAERRALAVSSDPPAPLYVGRPSVRELEAASAAVAAASGDALRPHVQSWVPTLVRQPLDDGQNVLVPAEWKKIGHPPDPKQTTGRIARHFVVQPLWFDGPEATADRAELDAFLGALIDHSTFADFFRGQATFSLADSRVIPVPAGGTDLDNRSHWLEAAVAGIPQVPTGATPLYLVLGAASQLSLRQACGYHQLATVNHGAAVLATVRVSPPCWPGASRMRSETQIAAHEIAEGADLALGHLGCVANGRCEGNATCGTPCDTFTGLTGPGAPEWTHTGCAGGRVAGWVVQRLAHKGWDDGRCTTCAACDFTVEARP